jgi:hypothetical protein
MLTFAAPTSSDLATARTRNETTWSRYLDAYVRLRFAEAAKQFTPDGRIVFAQPVPGMPAAVAGRDSLLATWHSFGAAVHELRCEDVRFRQTDDLDVAFVEYRLRVRLRRGGVQEHRLLVRATFAGEQITELVEHYEGDAHERLLAAVRAAARLV